jgi:hypothetical protein
MFPVFRFDGMETADWEPDRRTVSVRLNRNAVTGRLGVKISHTPSGIYVDSVEPGGDDEERRGVFCKEVGRLGRGDRLLAVNGLSIEHLGMTSQIK